MDRIIKVRVNGSHLEKDSRYAGVQGECNARHLHITFDQGWDGYAKTVTFWDALGLNPVKRDLTADLLDNLLVDTRSYLVPIPGEAMTEAGEMTFVIDGYADGKRQRSVKAELIVQESPMEPDAGEPADPTPSQAEQLQVQIDTLLGDMQDRAVRAENAAQVAEESAQAADKSETNALTSEQAAALSAQAAGQSEANAGIYRQGAYDNAVIAQNAGNAAQEAASRAETAAQGAESDRAAAESAAQRAASSESNAGVYMQNAQQAAQDAAQSAAVAEQYQNSSEECGAAAGAAQASAAAAAQSAKEAAEYAEQAAEIAGGDISVVVDGKISGHNVSTTAHKDIRDAVTAASKAAAAAQTTANSKEASGTAASAVSTHNSSTTAHSDIRKSVSAAAAAAATAQSTAESRMPVAGYYEDMNGLVASGVYRVGSNANLPEALWYGQVLVMQGTDSDTVAQIGVGYESHKIWSRAGKQTDGVWSFTDWGEEGAGLVKQAGDTMTGPLKFENLEDYFSIIKGRTLADGSTHWLTVGVGSNGKIALEHYKGSTTSFADATLDGRLELGAGAASDPNALALRPDVDSGTMWRIFGDHNLETLRELLYSSGTADLAAGTSALATGKLYFVYE